MTYLYCFVGAVQWLRKGEVRAPPIPSRFLIYLHSKQPSCGVESAHDLKPGYIFCRFLNDALQMLWPAFDTALCKWVSRDWPDLFGTTCKDTMSWAMSGQSVLHLFPAHVFMRRYRMYADNLTYLQLNKGRAWALHARLLAGGSQWDVLWAFVLWPGAYVHPGRAHCTILPCQPTCLHRCVLCNLSAKCVSVCAITSLSVWTALPCRNIKCWYACTDTHSESCPLARHSTAPGGIWHVVTLWCAELDVDVRWAGEPDVLLKLEPSTKWITNAVKIGTPSPAHIWEILRCLW